MMHFIAEKKSITRLYLIIFTLSFFSLLLHGCTVKQYIPPPSYPESPRTPVTEPDTPPATYSPQLGAASSLYHQAETSLAQGFYHQAELELERALRIEPRNADYWYTMARIKFGQNLHKQTIQFCLKSKSLAGKNGTLIKMNDELISRARRQQSK